MKHQNQTTQRLTDNFERFNPYAAAAVANADSVEDGDIFAVLALAFELSQLRYQLSKRLDNTHTLER